MNFDTDFKFLFKGRVNIRVRLVLYVFSCHADEPLTFNMLGKHVTIVTLDVSSRVCVFLCVAV